MPKSRRSSTPSHAGYTPTTDQKESGQDRSHDGFLVSALFRVGFVLLVASIFLPLINDVFKLQKHNGLNKDVFVVETYLLELNDAATFTLPSITIGSFQIALLLLVTLWFYTQHSHEKREEQYYHSTVVATPKALLQQGLGPLASSTDGASLYLDVMKRSLLNIPY